MEYKFPHKSHSTFWFWWTDFRCLFNSCFRLKENSHFLQRNAFWSSWTCFMCFLRFGSLPHLLGQKSHWKGFSLLWITSIRMFSQICWIAKWFQTKFTFVALWPFCMNSQSMGFNIDFSGKSFFTYFTYFAFIRLDWYGSESESEPGRHFLVEFNQIASFSRNFAQLPKWIHSISILWNVKFNL